MPELLYWDSSVFLAWFMNEARDSAERTGMQEIVTRVTSGDALLISSAIMLTEVFPARMPATARKSFHSLFDRPDTRLVSVDRAISERARIIREIHQAETPARKIPTPDAIHLATAQLYRAERFYTFDGSLLRLNNSAGGQPLQITNPFAVQPNLIDPRE